jgi:hypothetical protein
MKNIKFLLILNLVGRVGFVVAQNTISIEDIYKNNTFKAEFVTSGNAMRDGDHFTTAGFADENMKEPAVVIRE